MKGPFGRVRLNVNRHWKCPRCGLEASSPGTVVWMTCSCRSMTGDDAPEEPAWMTYLEEKRPRNAVRFDAAVPIVELAASEFVASTEDGGEVAKVGDGSSEEGATEEGVAADEKTADATAEADAKEEAAEDVKAEAAEGGEESTTEGEQTEEG